MSRSLEFKAKDNTDRGHQIGEHFRDRIQAKIAKAGRAGWDRKVRRAVRAWKIACTHFPDYGDEVRAYARAAKVGWQDLWTVGLELGTDADRCTALVTNGGRLVGHDEDFEPGSAHDLFLIRKTVGKSTVLDLHYFYTLGGNAASVNSNGWCLMVNSLHGSTSPSGIPRNVIARWLSETRDPQRDARRLRKLPLMDGYSYTFVHLDGRISNLETSAKGVSMEKVRSPFVHTNHHLSRLKEDETFASGSSVERFTLATRRLKPRMSVASLKRLMADRSRGDADSIFNEDTIGRMVVDFTRREAPAWFKASPRRGYLTVPLDFLP